MWPHTKVCVKTYAMLGSIDLPMKMRETSRARDKKLQVNNNQAQSSNSSDAGTTNRVLAEILRFLNEDGNNIFVIMTSNNVSQLPPEFTRSGRIDAQWYFGLPTLDERQEIFRIHFSKTGRSVTDKIIIAAAKAANNYTGAEIKEVVKVSMRKAYNRFKTDGNPELTELDITSAVGDIIPLFKSSEAQILALESYSRGRARNSHIPNGVNAENADESQLFKDLLQLKAVN